MNDVAKDGGPFVYCKNSHKNKLERLLFEFMRGQLKDFTKNHGEYNNTLIKGFSKTILKNFNNRNIK